VVSEENKLLWSWALFWGYPINPPSHLRVEKMKIAK